MGEQVGEKIGEPFDLLLGRKTYEIFAAHWPYVGDDPVEDKLNGATKYVASITLETVDWSNSTLIDGDVAEAVARLKEGSGPEIQVHGSSNLIQTLLKHDLLDEYRLWFFPLVLGTGKRLFADGAVPGTNEPATSSTDRSRSKNQPRRSSNGVRDSPTAEEGDEWTRDPCPR
jgi:dihydrofolate reductase